MNARTPIARRVKKIDNHKTDMQKPNVRGPSPSRKAHLVLGENLNRKSKPPPKLPAKSPDKARRFDRNELKQHE